MSAERSFPFSGDCREISLVREIGQCDWRFFRHAESGALVVELARYDGQNAKVFVSRAVAAALSALFSTLGRS